MHLDQRCSSAISPELKKSGSFPLTHSSTAITTSLSDRKWLPRISFLAHLNQRFKWAILIKICPLSVVVVGVVVGVVNFSYFHLLLWNHWANFNQTWQGSSLGDGDSSLFKWCSWPPGFWTYGPKRGKMYYFFKNLLVIRHWTKWFDIMHGAS